MIDAEKKKLSQHLKNTYKNDIGILHFDGELDQFLAFLLEGKEKFNEAISKYHIRQKMKCHQHFLILSLFKEIF